MGAGWSRGERRGRGGPQGRHAEGNGVVGAVAAHHGDSLVDVSSLGVVELGNVTLDPVDQPPVSPCTPKVSPG